MRDHRDQKEHHMVVRHDRGAAWLRSAAALAVGLLVAGCYESLEPERRTSASPPPQQEPATTPGVANTPRPALSGAKRSADNTAQRMQQHQDELLKQMEEDG